MSDHSTPFSITVQPGAASYRVFVYIKWDGKRLSITGVEGPTPNGDCKGSAGQCIDSLRAIHVYNTDGPQPWDPNSVARLADIWDRWHLNDMRAGCEHQRQIDTTRKVGVVSYKLTHEAHRLRDETRRAAADAALRGEAFKVDRTAHALATLEDWYSDIFTPPDADGPLSGCYEVSKREMKAIGWVTQKEHPEGMVSKLCEVCGYKYGSAWLHEDVPADVIEWLRSLPQVPAPAGWPNR